MKILLVYTGKGLNVDGYLTWNEDKTVLAIVDLVTEADGQHSDDASLIVRLEDKLILIDRDMTTPILM